MKQPPEITAAKRRIREAYKRGELTEEQIELLSSVGFNFDSLYEHAVVCYETGELFDSVKQAANSVGFSSPSALMRSLRCGICAGGFHWYYADKPKPVDSWFKASRKRCVVCVELGRYFESIMAAERGLGLPEGAASAISLCCRGKGKTAYNYHWRYATEEEIAAGKVLEKDELFGTEPVRFRKPVVCIELGYLFESSAAAARKLGLPKKAGGNIGACCCGRKKTVYNYHWRYATEEEIAAGKVLPDDRGDA